MEWYVLLMLSAFFIALAELLEKKALFSVHAMELLGMRGLFTGILLLFLIPFVNWSIPPLAYMLAILVGVLLTFGLLYKSKAMRHLEVSTTAPLMNFSPVVILIIAAAFLHEYPAPVQIIGVFLIMGGAYALQVQSSKDLFSPLRALLHSKYIQYIVFVIFTFAVTATIDRFVLTNYPVEPLTYLFLIGMTTALLSVFLDVMNYGTVDIVRDLQGKKLLFLSISLFMLLSVGFFLTGISMEGALIALAIPIKRFSTLIVTVVGGSLFHEKHMMRKAVSCVVMIIGGTLIIL